MNRIPFATLNISSITASVMSDAGEGDPQRITWRYDAAEGKFRNEETSMLRTVDEIEVFLKALIGSGCNVLRVDVVYM